MKACTNCPTDGAVNESPSGRKASPRVKVLWLSALAIFAVAATVQAGGPPPPPPPVIPATYTLSRTPAGKPANSNSISASIGYNGLSATFTSLSSNLVPGYDPQGNPQVFYWNGSASGNTSALEPISFNESGDPAAGPSYFPHQSDGGRYVVFTSYGDNLVSNDYNGSGDVFLYDRFYDEMLLVSQSSEWLMSGNGDSGYDRPAISATGSVVAFSSLATDLNDKPGIHGPGGGVGDDSTDEGQQLYTWGLFLASPGPGEHPRSAVQVVNNDNDPALYFNELPYEQRITGEPVLDHYGENLAYVSNAVNWTEDGVDGNTTQVFLRVSNSDAGPGFDPFDFYLVSQNVNGDPANANCSNPSINQDGVWMSFESAATNLLDSVDAGPALPPALPAGVVQVYVTDGDNLSLASSDADGNPANADCTHSRLSADGQFLIFTSAATNLVAGRGGNQSAVFVKNLDSGDIVAIDGSDGAESTDFNSYDTRFVDFAKLVQTGTKSASNPPLWQVIRQDRGVAEVKITSGPYNQFVYETENATLSVVATGLPAPTYQWYDECDNPLEGETNSTLSFTNVTLDQDGSSYYCIVSNALGDVTSRTATLYVEAPDGPEFDGEPDDQVIVEGDNLSVPVDVSGFGNLTYQWFYSADDMDDYTPIEDQTTDTLAILGISTEDEGYYYLEATDSLNQTSDTDTFFTRVLGAEDPPYIDIQPDDDEVTEGDSASFYVTAYGAGNLTYQWYNCAGLIPDATSSELYFDSVTLGDADHYYVIVTNEFGNTTSDKATLTVDAGTAPTIDETSGKQKVVEGDDVEMWVDAYGDGDLSFQWYFNGNIIEDATDSEYDISNVTLSAAGNYTVTVSNDFGNTTSDPLCLKVCPATAPVINDISDSRTDTEGDYDDLSVDASYNGDGDLSYQWYLNGNILEGQTGDAIYFDPVLLTDAGNYTVTITNPVGGNITSDPIVLGVDVGPEHPQITTQPVATSGNASGNATLSVAAIGGSADVQFLWLHDGVPVTDNDRISGSNSGNLTFTGLLPEDAGSYQVVAYNGVGYPVTSDVVQVTVNFKPRIVTQPKAQLIRTGRKVTFTVVVQAVPTPTFQWTHNGSPVAMKKKIPTAKGVVKTSNSFSIAQVKASDAGIYRVKITNSQGSVTSNSVGLQVRNLNAPAK